jgi:hypothetical protein
MRCKICGGKCKKQFRYCKLCTKERRRLVVIDDPQREEMPREAIESAKKVLNLGNFVRVIASSALPTDLNRTTVIMDDETLAAFGYKWEEETQGMVEAKK